MQNQGHSSFRSAFYFIYVLGFKMADTYIYMKR